MRANAGLYLLEAYYYLKPGVNANMNLTNVHDFFFQGFSRHGNKRLLIPGLFQAFHDRTNPVWSYAASTWTSVTLLPDTFQQIRSL